VSRKEKSQRSPSLKVNSAKVERGIEAIRSAYKTGQKILERIGRRGEYKSAAIQKEAERLGLNENVVRKLRQIAEPEDGFTEQELEKLLEISRKHEWAIGPAYLYKIVSIPKKHRLREKFVRQAARGQWNRARIDLEIRQHYRQRPHGGRRMKIAASIDTARLQALATCERWLTWFNEFETKRDDPEFKQLLDSLQKQLPAAQRAVRRLREELVMQQQGNEKS